MEFQWCQQAVTPLTAFLEKVTWQAPIGDVVKINFDGSFRSSSLSGSFGAVARDCEGQVLGAMAGPLFMVCDSFAAEALAALKAMVWARDMRFIDIILEGDALSIIWKVNSPTHDLSPIGPYIEELKLYCSFFHSCKFSHIKRDGNAVGNSLAKYGSSLPANVFWMEEVPSLAMDALLNDCNACHME
ncbi:hypothetical protein COLO4_05919 [Corchorus olitorius]|uniref:RNase H type-1 domain-containing protein n=1 Tax=Corchorus olitorius TaxID=93759 RepID=A0A1R3KPH7_9ROSI|nr:hypothetical protein COLO4_05919 [Corchorus olitorius]